VNAVDPYVAVRTGGLYLPIILGALAWSMRRPSRRALVGAFVSLAWALPALFSLHVVAINAGWWLFDASGGVLMGMPVDLWLGWAILWGPVASIVFPRMPLPAIAIIVVAIDLVLMPAAFPVVRLGEDWLLGEAVAIVSCLLPALLLARWTANDRHLAGRAMLQVIAFSALIALVLPAAIIAVSGSTWRNPFEWPTSVVSVMIQLLALPAILGLSAVQEFVTRGGGTPIPYDPPRHIVTSGVYAYVANPMQLSAALLLIAIGAVINNVFVGAAGIMSIIYSAGIAHWDEDVDLRQRFGGDWATYRRGVRRWVPRWRPWYQDEAPVATLYVAEECGMCREVASWYRARGVRGLAIMPAEDHPRGGLTRITYESTDGRYRATGINALGRALEHIHFGWAFTGIVMRLPVVAGIIQLIVDASGGEPRLVPRKPSSQTPRP
jgi:protein-S-isoprenylcysteine O-methyltransferase Ste14